jgi:hypothetical protein
MTCDASEPEKWEALSPVASLRKQKTIGTLVVEAWSRFENNKKSL